MDITHLKEILNYNPETGIFTWKSRRPRIRVGQIAGSKNNERYVNIKIDGILYKAHRLAWLYMTGEWPKDQIDHINGIRDDNRFCNLREVTNASNQWNKTHNKNNKAGYKNLYVYRNKRTGLSYWRVGIKHNKSVYVKHFPHNDDGLQLAIHHRNEKLKELHGDYCKLD